MYYPCSVAFARRLAWAAWLFQAVHLAALLVCWPPDDYPFGLLLLGLTGLSLTSLTAANLRGASLSWAYLRLANLSGADLTGAILRGANLYATNLRVADLRDADLRWADLSGADLRGADLRDADLHGANLHGADLREANLGGADLSRTGVVMVGGGPYQGCVTPTHVHIGCVRVAVTQLPSDDDTDAQDRIHPELPAWWRSYGSLVRAAMVASRADRPVEVVND